MTRHPFRFVLPLAAMLVAWPAAGQDGVPDFSGVWHRWFRPGLGPAASGPGPLTNRALVNGVSDYNQLVGDFTNLILKPEAAQTVKELGELSRKGIGYPTPSNQCWPSGVPYVFWNFGVQFLQRPERITMLYLHDHEVRQIRMNGTHPALTTPKWYGDSVGHYEGDTLVIDTVGMNAKTFADNFRTPHTEKLHVTERLRRIEGGKILEVRVTADDPDTFVQPWQGTRRYNLGKPIDRGEAEPGHLGVAESICQEGNLTASNLRSADYNVPVADKPDF